MFFFGVIFSKANGGASPSKLFAFTHRKELCADATESFVVLGTQVVGGEFVAEFMDEKLDDINCDAALEPLGAEPQLVENQISAWA